MPETPLSLLDHLRNHPQDPAAWDRFSAIYRPLLERWLRHYDVPNSDGDDLIQETLQLLLTELPRFQHDASKGKFRGWLRTVLVNRLRPYWRSRKRTAAEQTRFEEQLDQLTSTNGDLQRRWDREHDEHVLGQLLTQIRADFNDTTWETFQRLMQGEAPAHIASALGVTTNAVYLSRSHVLHRLREVARGLVD